MQPDKDLRQQVERQARRMQKAEQDRPTLMGQTIYLGTLGLMLVLPILVGAYLGHWLDEKSTGYSMFWTISLILLGLVIGMLNLYFFIKE